MKKALLVFLFSLIVVCSWAQQPQLVLPVGHTGYLRGVHFSSDDKRIISYGNQNTILIWDAQTYQLLNTIKWTNGQVVSFIRGKHSIAAIVDDTLLKISDLMTGKCSSVLKHKAAINTLAISNDGRYLATLSADSLLHIWETATGCELAKIKISVSKVDELFFSLDDKELVIRYWSGILKSYSIAKGQQHFEYTRDTTVFDGENYFATGPALVSGNRLIVQSDSAVNIWDRTTGRLQNEIKFDHRIHSITFSPDGSKIVIAYGKNLEIVNVVTGKVLQKKKGNDYYGFLKCAFSSDGASMLISLWDKSIEVWSMKSLRRVATLAGHTNKIIEIAGNSIVTGSPGVNNLKVWNLKSGSPLHNLDKSDLFRFISISSIDKEGKYIVVENGSSSGLWNLVSGEKVATLNGSVSSDKPQGNFRAGRIVSQTDSSVIVTAAETGTVVLDVPRSSGYMSQYPRISPDGSKICFDSSESVFKIIDVSSRKEIMSFRDTVSLVSGYAFSKDSRMFVLTRFDSTAKVWDISSGKLLMQIKAANCLKFPDFSPDGEKLLFQHVIPVSHLGQRGFMADSNADVYNISTGQLAFSISSDRVTQLFTAVFEHNDKTIVAYVSNELRLLDAENGKTLISLKGHDEYVTASVLTPDEKYIYTASDDNTVKKWTADGSLLYTMIFIDSSDYLVIDKDFHFDGTPAARKMLHLSCGDEVISLDQLKELLWVPGLRERIDKGEPIHAKKLKDLDICGLTPRVEEMGKTAGVYTYKITPRRGGLGETVVSINGVETKRYGAAQLTKKQGYYELVLSDKELLPFLQGGGGNEIMVRAYTAKNDVSSKGLNISMDSMHITQAAPNLYALMIGVSEYKDEDLHLKYAAKDANELGQIVKTSTAKLLGAEHVNIYNLVTSNDRYLLPEKEAIHRTLLEIGSKAKPNDILLIFFSGHGVLDAKTGKFYFLSSEATSESALDDVGISSQELTDWIQPSVLKAQKRILIFDACHSGQAINNMIKIGQDKEQYVAARSDEKAQQVKAIDKLNERSGLFILAASSSNESAYELGRYSQGLLTYALLKTIKQQADVVEDNKYLNINRWFAAADHAVSELAAENGMSQQAQIVGAGNFNLGIVDDDILNMIHLPEEKPFFTPGNFQNSDTAIAYDDLDITTLVNKQLNAVATKGTGNTIAYTSNSVRADAWKLSGRYTVTGDNVSTSVLILYRNEIRYRITVTGDRKDLQNLAGQIVAKALAELQKK